MVNDDEDGGFFEKIAEQGDYSSMADKAQDRERKREAKRELNFDHLQDQEQVPIKKDLYIESNEITNMSAKEVSEFRRVNGDIKVRGIMVPKPIKNWY